MIELRMTGLLGANDELDCGNSEDDGLCQELRALQRELLFQSSLNNRAREQLRDNHIVPQVEKEQRRAFALYHGQSLERKYSKIQKKQVCNSAFFSLQL